MTISANELPSSGAQQSHPRRAGQVVEAVTVLQVEHLALEDQLKVEPSRPPNRLVRSARPPTQRSMSSTPLVETPFAALAQAPLAVMKASASGGTQRRVGAQRRVDQQLGGVPLAVDRVGSETDGWAP